MKSLLSEIDNYIVAREKKKLDEEVIDCHRPSSISKCIREMYYIWTKEPISNYPTATDVYRFEIGNWIHDGIQKILEEMYGDNAESELSFIRTYDGLKFPVIGHIDSVLSFISDEWENKEGIELKTSFGQGISSIAKNGQPKPEHVEQIKAYMINTGMKKFYLPYLGRDSFYRTEFIIEMTDEERKSFKQKMIERFKKIEYHVENKIIPDRTFTAVIIGGEIKKEAQRKNVKYKSDWQCTWCYYRDTCYAEELESLDEFLTIDDYK